VKEDLQVYEEEPSSTSPTYGNKNQENKNKNEIDTMTDDEFIQADNLVHPDASIADLMKRSGSPYGNATKTILQTMQFLLTMIDRSMM